MAAESPSERSTRLNGWVLASTSLGSFTAAAMGTSVNVALPSLADHFGTQVAAMQWVVLAYLVTTASLLPIVGRAADLFGKRTLFAAGFVVFALGSLATGLAPSVVVLIAFRVVHGVGASVLTGLALAIVTDVHAPSVRGRAIGIAGAMLSLGIVVGPALGGALVALSWRWVFLAGVPVGIVGAALAWSVLPRAHPTSRPRFDVTGSALLASTLALVAGLATLAPRRAAFDPWMVAAWALAALSTAAFVLHQRRSASPIVPPTLFRNLDLSLGLAIGWFTFASISGTIFVMPFYLERVLALSPVSVGVLMSITPVLLVLLSPIAGQASDRFGPRIVSLVGLSFALAGFTAVSTLSAETTPLGYVLRFVPVGIGMGTFQTSNNASIMASAPPSATGVVGGLLGLTRTLGQVVGTAVLGSYWAARVVAAGGVGDPAEVAGVRDMMHVVVVFTATSWVLASADVIRRVRRNRP